MCTFLMDPMVTRDAQGKLGGMIVEVTEHIAKLEGFRVEYVLEDFSRCMEMLEAGTIDFSSPVAYTPERARKIEFTNETLIMDWGQIYSNHDVRVNTILDLDGKRVVTLERTVFNEKFLGLIDSFGVKVEFIRVGDYMDVFRYVESGRADAMIVNRAFGEKNVRDFHVTKTPIIFQPIDIKYATPMGERHAELRKSLDSALSGLRAEPGSEYHAAIGRMFGDGASMAIPGWLYWTGGGALGVFALMSGLNLLLRHRVNQRTAELRKENAERREAEGALRESRETFRALVEFTSAIHWEYDIAADRFTYVSPQSEALLGYNAGDWSNLDAWAGMLHPEDREGAVEFCLSRTGAGEDHALTYRLVASDGRMLWMRDIVKVIKDGGNRPVKLIGIMLDITEQKQQEQRLDAALREKEVLIQEIHHRVKNNLAIVASLGSLQAQSTRDEGAVKVLMENQSRIRSMALVHEQLYRSETLTHISARDYIKKMAGNLLRTYGVERSDVMEINAEDLPLGIDTMIPFGLLLNEVLTNAIKYAYDDPAKGRYFVEFHSDGAKARLTVRDEGRGLPEGFDIKQSGSLGMRLIETLANQLSGDFEITSGSGTEAVLEFPLHGAEG